MQVKLKVLAGSNEGKEIAINTEKFLIGRSDECQLRPKSESVSRRHCAIVQKDGRVLLVDLKSRNGTFVNDKPVASDKAKILKDGDKLTVGKLEFQVAIEVSLGGAKKSEIKDLKDAAARAADSGNSDSRYESVDVSMWLEEADQVQRVRKDAEPDTRQLVLDETARIDLLSNTDSNASGSTAPIASVGNPDSDPGSKSKRPDKKEPAKLPKGALNTNNKSGGSSRDAANETLKKFFSGR